MENHSGKQVASRIYIYSLIINGKLIGSQRMILSITILISPLKYLNFSRYLNIDTLSYYGRPLFSLLVDRCSTDANPPNRLLNVL